jgi:DNA polymerase-3 subunit alpha
MPALAVTDHGNMFGAIEFYLEAMRSGIKPIIGSEVYVAPGSRFEKGSSEIQEASFHLVLLAKDEQGYKNLMRLVSIGYLEGFYYRPRIDKEVLSQYSKGLVGLSSCLKGEIPYLLKSNQDERAVETAACLADIFGRDNFFLELMDNGLPQQKRANEGLIRIARQLRLGLVATGDVHYIEKSHARAHELLLCIQTQTTLNDPTRLKFQSDEFYFKSPQEMKGLFSSLPEAISNTIAIAEMCNLELDFSSTYLPDYVPPQGQTKEEFLRQLCLEGLKRRYGGQISAAIHQRLEHELEVIKKLGFSSYFLIVWDFIRYAKERGISVGPGRGSAAGSLVSFLLGITDIDPLKYGLFFERFLNPERVSLPDIDIDFCYERRPEVIEYVIQKYSKDNVAQIITFGTMQARAVVRDVGRAMGLTYSEVDKIAKLIPPDPNISLKKAIDSESELRSMFENDPRIRSLLENSLILEGLTRHASTHAAGIVISPEPLVNYVPLFRGSNGENTTGYAHSALEKIGLLKVDFLGLRTLTVIEETLKIISRTQGKTIQIESIPLDDPVTFGLLSRAESIGVFQLESSGMRDILRKLSPEKFEDIIAILALYRPGPIGSGMVDEFIKRKHGHIPVRYDHPKLEPILKNTYGIVVYQEQVMRIASELAGFSLAGADLLRRAMSKKTPEVMEQQRKNFVLGCRKNGIDEKIANKIFNLMEYFAGYGFNLSHSAAYALISYRTAFLKANYPVEFMTALLTSEKDNTDKVVEYINEANRMGIEILPPDVNESFAKFTAVGRNKIRFGLLAVKNVGQAAIDSIVQARQRHGRFKTLYEFCERVDLRLVNRKVIESLIKCGAFDSLGLYRSQLMSMLDKALEAASSVQKDRAIGQLSFFDMTNSSAAGFDRSHRQVPAIKEWPEGQLLSFEKEILGFYISGHPLARYWEILKSYATCTIDQLTNYADAGEVIIGGVVNKARQTTTRSKAEKMAIVKLEDLTGIVEVILFPEAFAKYNLLVKPGATIFVKGKADLREEQPKIVANEVVSIQEATAKWTEALSINLFTAGLEEEVLLALKNVLLRYPGKVPLFLNFTTVDGGKTRIMLNDNLRIQPSQALIREIEGLLGEGVVNLSTIKDKTKTK